MKKTIILTIALILIAFPLFSQMTATVKQVKGKVEMKAPGKGWVRATTGMNVPKGTFISTGFRSTAILELGPSEITVRQLTRMQLEELIQKEGTIQTGLYLKAGSVSGKVKSAKGLKHDFKLRSPNSTAAVRGTDIPLYTPYKLVVSDGEVMLINQLGQTIWVTDRASIPENFFNYGSDEQDKDSDVSPYSGKTGGVSTENETGFTGDIIIIFEKP